LKAGRPLVGHRPHNVNSVAADIACAVIPYPARVASVDLVGRPHRELNPRITIPDLEDDAEIELEFAANFGSAEDSDSVTVFAEYLDGEVEDAEEESLVPADSA
jgi:hypothetical protein